MMAAPYVSNKFPFLLLAFIIFTTIATHAQDRCGTTSYIQKLKNDGVIRESDAQFEQWLQNKKALRKQTLDADGRTQTTTYQIPVVVHVIHNGEAVGTGSNISDAQIISQIKVLNDDFQRLNADATNTPSEFQSAAGSLSIEFILAKQDPHGVATTGIVRVQGSQSSWSIDDNYDLKATSYWPADDYMNIWVCNLQDYLGYTQFPASSTLQGLEDASNNAQTDGVVIGYPYFGSIDGGNFNLAARYDKGRTVTHEVGHFFGLRHIWGDVDNCGGTDYVDDTPNQNGNSSGCPTGALPSCTAGIHKMYQNYMDYTDDACMNLYTKGQFDRMITVLANSPRRKTLSSSHGLADATPIPNDLSIRDIVSPATSQCDLFVTPSIEIQNFGNNAITSATIQVLINGNVAETKTFTGTLNPGDVTTMTFSQQLRAEGTTVFAFNVTQVNGATDYNTFNNSASVTTSITLPVSVPFTQDFSTQPANWVIQNPDQLIHWALKTAPFADASNKAMYVDMYDYTDHNGELDMIFSPPFDLTATSVAYLSFNEAYARYDNTSTDGLRVIVIPGCTTDITSGTEVYNKSGSALATASNTSLSFTPKSENDWRTEIIDLKAFIGSRIRLAFVSVNGYGNNIYLDNVSVVTDVFGDLEISKISNPDVVTCPNPTPKIFVKNVGTSTVTSFKVQYSVNAGALSTIPVNNLSMAPGTDTLVVLPPLALSNGANAIAFSITSLNGNQTDINPLNSQKSVHTFVNSASDIVPIKENFDDDTAGNWVSIDPGGGTKWSTTSTNYQNSYAFTSKTLNDQAWLVSPSLDFSQVNGASVFFDISYVWDGLSDPSDELQVMASVGCGNLFTDHILYDSGGSSLATTSSTRRTTSDWKSSDWRRVQVDVSELSGHKDVRLAFVGTHLITGASNSLYIDNIEFYAASNPPIAERAFAIYTLQNDPTDFYITFELDKKQAVSVDIIDMMGRSVAHDVLTNVLNETYPINLDNTSTGVYVVRLLIDNRYAATKVFIKK